MSQNSWLTNTHLSPQSDSLLLFQTPNLWEEYWEKSQMQKSDITKTFVFMDNHVAQWEGYWENVFGASVSSEGCDKLEKNKFKWCLSPPVEMSAPCSESSEWNTRLSTC